MDPSVVISIIAVGIALAIAGRWALRDLRGRREDPPAEQ
jgi:hypothetical protein